MKKHKFWLDFAGYSKRSLCTCLRQLVFTKRLSIVLIVLSALLTFFLTIIGPFNAVAAPAQSANKQPELSFPFDVTKVEVGIGASNTAEFICQDVQWKNQSGEPQIPWQVITVLLPPETVLDTVVVNLKHARFETITGQWDVSPSPPVAIANKETQQFWPKDKRIVNGRDADIYEKDALWPQFEVQLISTGEMRKWKLAQVAIPLIKYNPAQKMLKKLISGELQIYFDRIFPVLTDPAINSKMRDRIGENTIRKIAVNFEQQNAAYTETMSKSKILSTEENKLPLQTDEEPLPGYVIITTSEIQAASQKLNDFVAHKQSKGFDVQVITDANFGGGIGDTAAENIRSWLQAHYISDNIQYVLLIGNPDPNLGDIPMKMLYPRSHETENRESPSDYYYADLTGNWDLDNDGLYGEWGDDFAAGGVDRNWEVLVGRISCYPLVEPNEPQGQILYDSGEPQGGLYEGGSGLLGFVSGNRGSGMEQRWAAHPFTIPEGTWNITQILIDYATYSNAPFDLVKFIVWHRNGQNRPVAGDEIVQGVVPAPISLDDPRIPEADNYLHYIDVNFPLDGGDYYLTVYGGRSDGQPNCYFGWLGNTENGIPLLNPDPNPNPGVNAFFWRSAQFPTPGFATYNLPKSTWDSLPGQDPNRLYTAAFTIYGTADDSNGGSYSKNQQTQTESMDINELDHILTKIITYENCPQSESMWRQNILLPMKSDGGTFNFTYMLGEEIRENIISGKTGWNSYRIYDSNYSLNPSPELTPCTRTNVTGAWSDSPFGVVAWATHGSSTAASYVMDTAYAATLDDNYPAFTFQASCLNADPETPVNLAYSLLKNGAISTIGATRVAWGYFGYQTSFGGTVSIGGLAYEYISRLVGEGIDSGSALNNMKSVIAPYDMGGWMNFLNLNIYGCPAIGLSSYAADAMVVSPRNGLFFEGDTGGPFEPNQQVYTIINESNQPIDYKVDKTQAWLSLNGVDGPITGMLEPNESDSIVVSLNSNADHLAAGLYKDSVEFMNLTTGFVNANRRIRLKPAIKYGGSTVVPGASVLATDQWGNVFVAGYDSYGDGKTHIIEIDPNGNQLWHYIYTGSVSIYSIYCDVFGNIFLHGKISGTVDLDPTSGEDWFSSANGTGFVSRINRNGNYEWTFQTSAGSYEVYMAVDAIGNFVLSGYFKGTVDFDPSDGEDWRSAGSYYDIYVTKFGADKSYLWTRTIGGASKDDFVAGITTDGSGNAILSGSFQSTVDFDPTDGVDIHISNGGFDAFVTKLTSNGNYCWTRTAGGTGREFSNDVTVDYNGNIFIAGYFDDEGQPTPYSVDFNPGDGIDMHICMGGEDAFVTKFGSDGEYLWTRTIANQTALGGTFGGAYQNIDAISTDGAGGLLITGVYEEGVDVDFDPTYETDWRGGRGYSDIFLTRLGSDGSYHWTGTMGGSSGLQDVAGDVVIDCKGNVFVSGYFAESADLDPTENDDWYDAGSLKKKGFITKIIHGAVPVIITDSDHDGDVDMNDLHNFVLNWLEIDCANQNWCDWSDYDHSTKVDFADFAFLANQWLEGL